jgi:hypothetical protein
MARSQRDIVLSTCFFTISAQCSTRVFPLSVDCLESGTQHWILKARPPSANKKTTMIYHRGSWLLLIEISSWLSLVKSTNMINPR